MKEGYFGGDHTVDYDSTQPFPPLVVVSPYLGLELGDSVRASIEERIILYSSTNLPKSLDPPS